MLNIKKLAEKYPGIKIEGARLLVSGTEMETTDILSLLASGADVVFELTPAENHPWGKPDFI